MTRLLLMMTMMVLESLIHFILVFFSVLRITCYIFRLYALLCMVSSWRECSSIHWRRGSVLCVCDMFMSTSVVLSFVRILCSQRVLFTSIHEEVLLYASFFCYFFSGCQLSILMHLLFWQDKLLVLYYLDWNMSLFVNLIFNNAMQGYVPYLCLFTFILKCSLRAQHTFI
jgi:hypothetical protein